MRREDVEITDPCEVSWDGMSGVGMQRHCSHCHEDVVNLSMMTESEAEAFLEANHAPGERHEVEAPDLVEVVRDGGDSLSDALGQTGHHARGLASAAVDSIGDVSSYLVDAVEVPAEQIDPKPSRPEHEPAVMGGLAPPDEF